MAAVAASSSLLLEPRPPPGFVEHTGWTKYNTYCGLKILEYGCCSYCCSVICQLCVVWNA